MSSLLVRCMEDMASRLVEGGFSEQQYDDMMGLGRELEEGLVFDHLDAAGMFASAVQSCCVHRARCCSVARVFVSSACVLNTLQPLGSSCLFVARCLLVR